MRGERVATVGLSLSLHVCVAGMLLARVATTSGAPPSIPISVSLEAPPSIDHPVSAVASEALSPSDNISSLGPLTSPSTEPLAPAGVPPPVTLEPSGKNAEAPVAVPSQPGTTPPQTSEDLAAATQTSPVPAGQVITPTGTHSETPEITLGAAVTPSITTQDLLQAALPASEEGGSVEASPTQTAAELSLPEVRLSEAPPPTILAASSAAVAVTSMSASQPSAPEPGLPEAKGEAAQPSSALPPVDFPASLLGTVDQQVAPSRPAIPTAETLSPVVPTEVRQAALSAGIASIEEGPGSTPADTLENALRARQVRTFVDRYDGGPCFFAAVGRVSADSAEIESFSTTTETFNTFDRALKTSTGLEPTVSGQRIWSAQCAAVAYLRKLTHADEPAPSLDLDNRDLQGGEVLSGKIQRTDRRHLGLFVISEAGAVDDVSDAVSGGNGTSTFSFRPLHAAAGGPFPQMLVLLASDTKLPLHPTTVEALFGPTLDGSAPRISATAKLFLMSR